jgi:hypothetical protein
MDIITLNDRLIREAQDKAQTLEAKQKKVDKRAKQIETAQASRQ